MGANKRIPRMHDSRRYKMKKITTIILLILFLMPMALADGMIIDPYGPVMEKGQQAAIIYEKKGDEYLEKMIISVQTDPIHKDKAAWIFPVPAEPDDVVIDVVTQFPRMRGYEVLREAKTNIENIIDFAKMSLIFPIFLQNMFFRGGYAPMQMEALAKDAYIDIGQGVTIYEQIEKEGITVQTLGANEGSTLWIFLRREGLEVPMETITVFDHYIDEDYTFVVAFITPEESKPLYDEPYIAPEPATPEMRKAQIMPYYRGRNLGVEVMFHTDKLYYPLLPTSIYKSEKIPATIWVIGDHVTPKVYDKIEGFVETKYFKSTGYQNYPMLEEFFGDLRNEKNMKYTTISLRNVPSKYLTEDLWIEEKTPANIQYANWITSLTYRNTGKLGFLMIAIISALSGMIVGLIIFRENWWKLMIVSLANCLSIIALIIALVFVKTRKIDAKLKEQLREAGVLTVTRDFKKKALFIVGFIVAFYIIAWAIKTMFVMPLN